MKTILKYFASFALLIGLVSCQEALWNQENAPIDEVEVTLSVQFPEPVAPATRGTMAEGPLKSEEFEIYLCLYGSGEGYVQNWIPTTNVTYTYDATDTYITGGTFKAMLPLTDDRRVVHVVANPPAEVNPTTSGYMDNVMERMVNAGKTCSYWQQIELPYIKGTGDPLVLSAELRPLFANIHLVRNFVKVIVTDIEEPAGETEDFFVKRWALINVPNMGYVAPYNPNWKSEGRTSRFPDGYLNIQNYAIPDAPVKLYDKLCNSEVTGYDNYAGYMPPLATIDESFPGDPDLTENASKYASKGGAQYMYERPLPSETAKQTAVLVEVEFAADKDPDPSDGINSYWYKFELLDNYGEYMPLFRDIQYIVRLNEISEAGAATAEEAYNGSYFGNISASLETASLNELSNGTSRIHVDLMDYTFLDSDVTLTLMRSETEAAQFWFIPDESAPVIYYESASGICDIKVELLSALGYEPAVTAYTLPGNGSISVTLGQAGTSVKKSILRVSGRKGDNVSSNTERYIYREITVNLMNKPYLVHTVEGVDNLTRITNEPTVTGMGNEVAVRICLPEGLGASMFPIQLRIEAEKNTLSATSPDLPCQSGPSVYDASRNTFYYIYTVDYSDYCWLDLATHKYKNKYEFDIKFYTNKSGDNSTKIKITDLKDIFYSTELTLGTVTP